MVELAHRVDDVGAEGADFEPLAEKVEVQEGANVLFLRGGAKGVGVEPADEELEGGIFEFGEAEFLGAGGGGGFVVEGAGEEGGVVAEELFMERIVAVFFTDIDIDKSAAEESD